MDNKKKIGIFSFFLFFLTAFFVLSPNKASAETPGITVSGKFVDTITIVNVSNNEGGNLNWDLE